MNDSETFWHETADLRSAKIAELEAEVARLRRLCGEAAEFLLDQIDENTQATNTVVKQMAKRLRAAAAGKETTT